MNPAWALLRLASPQLPIGGYSYSQGLEMAVDNGRVKNPDDARRWISDQLLLNLARFEAPLLLAHCQAAADEQWAELQILCESHRASRETRELHLESRQMGYSLQQLLNGLPELDTPARDFLDQCPEPHLALCWALAARAWPGMPLVLVGRSDTLGWGLTSSYLDDQDVVIEKINPEHPEEYLTPEGPKKFTSRQTILAIKGADPVTLTLRWSQSGPILPASHYDLGSVTPSGSVKVGVSRSRVVRLNPSR